MRNTIQSNKTPRKFGVINVPTREVGGDCQGGLGSWIISDRGSVS